MALPSIQVQLFKLWLDNRTILPKGMQIKIIERQKHYLHGITNVGETVRKKEKRPQKYQLKG